MTAYRKLIVAIVGVLAMLSNKYFGVELTPEQQQMVLDGLLAALTAYGVWQATNEEIK